MDRDPPLEPSPEQKAIMRRYLADLRQGVREDQRRIRELEGTYGDAIEVVTMAELLDMDFPEPRWLIDSILPSDGITILGGDWGTHKTWLVTHAAICCAGSGRMFLDKLPTIQGARVLMLVMEGGMREHRRRVAALCQNVPNARDLPIFHHAEGSLDFDDEKVRGAVASTVRELRPDLVVVDNQRLAFGGDENDSEQARRVRLFMDEMNAAHKAAWWFIHHEKKPQGTKEVRRGHGLRGSSGHPGNLDSLVMVEAKAKDVGILHHEKARFGPKIEPIWFHFWGPEAVGGCQFQLLEAPADGEVA